MDDLNEKIIIYPAIKAERKSGEENFLGGETSARLIDFWRWAYSNLVGNTERGKLAEFIVALAMKCANATCESWAAFDVLSPENIQIEVKASAFLQS